MAPEKPRRGGDPAKNDPDRKQRSHDPASLGSRVYRKGRWYHIDQRWRGEGRPVLRNPKAPGWPEKGERTEDEDTAKAWARDYDDQWKQEQEEEAQRTTGKFRSVEAGVKHFLADRKRQNAHSTFSGSRTATSHLMEWVKPGIDPAEVTTEKLQEKFDELLDLEYKPSSLHNIRYHLNTFFDHLKVSPNPSRAVKLPKADMSDVVPWMEMQQQGLREAADEIDAERKDEKRTRRRLAECLLSMGPRIQEAAALNWEHIDSETLTVRISQQIGRATNLPAKTKGREPRSATVLKEWWELHDENAVGLIFPGKDGHPIPYRTLYDHVREILERAGLKELGVAAHQFRHTYAFLFLQREGTLDELSKCLGHKKVGTTQMYYDHFTSDHAARAAAQRMYRDAASIRRGPRKG